MNIKNLQKLKLPDKPGVYFFLKNKKVLYIGKATSLKDRTRSYFSKDLINTRGPLILDMVFKADDVRWEVSPSVLEALILEANLIKKHQPYYNTREKDDKSFNYVCITKPARNASHSDAGGEKLPRVVVVRGKNLVPSNFSSLRSSRFAGGTLGELKIQKNSVFGPYTSGSQLREALKIIRKIFPFLDEKSKNYMEFYRQINLAPDLNDRKLYLQNIRNIKLFFSGKKSQILRDLKKEMKNYAKEREFEKAGEIKRQIFALQHINDVALLRNEGQYFHKGTLGRSGDDGQRKFLAKNFRGESGKVLSGVYRIEAYDIAHMSGKNMVGVMTVVLNGESENSQYKRFKIRTHSGANDTGALTEVLERRLAHKEWAYPDLIVVDGGTAQVNAGQKVLKNLAIKIPVVSVVKDERHKPKAIMGRGEYATKYKSAILLANSEAHRFAIAYHKNMRAKNFLK